MSAMSDDLDVYAARVQEEILARARELYSETVIDHWQHPRNHGALEDAGGRASVLGICGDSTEISLAVSADKIDRAGFITDGCMTTFVAASMAAELATDKTLEQALAITHDHILTALGGLPEESEHCAKLAANALHAAIEDYRDKQSGGW